MFCSILCNSHQILLGWSYEEELGGQGILHAWEGREMVRKPEAVEWDGVDWIHLAKDRDKWQAVVDTVVNIDIS